MTAPDPNPQAGAEGAATMAAAGPYRYREYTAADLAAVAELQRQLLGDDVAQNTAYLRWKYHDNPQSDRPWAVVAEHESDGIVGFRGYIPSLWRLGRAGGDLPMLALADTCVDVGHRRRGLFSGMTRDSLDRFAGSGYRAIINLSTSPRPAPGYIKLGWRVMGHHGRLVRLTARGLWRRLTGQGGGHRPFGVTRRRSGFGCEVAHDARPAVMAALAAGERGAPDDRFALVRDEAFYAWRFRNVREKYTFAFASRDGEPVAFVVVRAEGVATCGAIIDFAETEPGAVGALVATLLGGGFDELSAWDPRPAGADANAWRARGFHDLDRLKSLAGRRREPMPILIRPLVPQTAQGDWTVHGRPLDAATSWRITEICSDGS